MSKTDYSQLYNQTAAPPQPVQPAQYPQPVQNAQPQDTQPAQAPQPAQYPNQPVRPAVKPRQAAPKKEFSPIAFLLIAGVSFLFLGGVIFLTSTWDVLSDAVRAIALLSVSGIAFGVNILAERVLKLPKTGLAFYILGCIFLPLALGGIGAFSLFGEWFSFYGEGRCLLLSLMAACVCATAGLGQSSYKSAALAGLSLGGLGMAWLFLCGFLTDTASTFFDSEPTPILFGFTLLMVAFAVGMTIYAERYLRRNPIGTTPLSKAFVPYLWAQNAVWLLTMFPVCEHAAVPGCLGTLCVMLLFMNVRFISENLHTGIFGFTTGVLLILYTIATQEVFCDLPEHIIIIFVVAGAAIFLLTMASIPKLCDQTRKAMDVSGAILCIPALFTAGISMLISLEEAGFCFLFLFVPLGIAAARYFVLPKNPLAKDTPYFALLSVLLFCIGVLSDGRLLHILLIIAALLLLLQFFLTKRLWQLVLAISASLAVITFELPNPVNWVFCIAAAMLLCGAVYAHLMRRPLLCCCCTLAGIPFLMAGLGNWLLLVLEPVPVWTLLLAVLALFYIAYAVVLRRIPHAVHVRGFCMDVSVILCIATAAYNSLETTTIGWMIVLVLATGVFAAGNLRRDINATALPVMLCLFAVLNQLLKAATAHPSLSEGWVLGLQIVGYLLILVLFAGMGRFLLPNGFFHSEKSNAQVDWGLLTAVLPIFYASSVIDWYPSILICLMLSVYSLLYIGRVKNRYIPAFLASAFGCLTVFFHNVNDPFGILESWYSADFRTPQILLWLLPMHLFILSLLWILPKQHRESVRLARFFMYCFTMLCILTASLSFNRAEDGICLAVFSLLILIGSFFVKRLRWFILGFSVLFLMTVKLTWEFWQSLHWGIYLFLAGAVLIGIAFCYEFAVRRANERTKNGEEKEKFKIFKEWKF
ncbi:MAG: hypothetical protein E7502_07150 [Ruminococcus sp.]|nr:hypothetical protein [Ruminococcus sp.]